MLNTTKLVTLNGQSVINGAVAETYTASINRDRPEDMGISSYQQDKALYKANRTECRADRAAFEEAAYAIQDELIAENSSSGQPTTEQA